MPVVNKRLPRIVKRLWKMRDEADHDTYLKALEVWDSTLLRATEQMPVHQRAINEATAILREMLGNGYGLVSGRVRRKAKRFVEKHGGSDGGR